MADIVICKSCSGAFWADGGHQCGEARDESVDAVAKDRADWLLDAVATVTQDRRFLRGDPEYDEIAGEAILLNGAKAIRAALTKMGEKL